MESNNLQSAVDIMSEQTKAIAEGIANLKIDLSGTEGQVEDQATIDWYKQRFEMLYADGVMDAINSYLNKAQRDTTMNEITRVMILKEATDIMCRDV